MPLPKELTTVTRLSKTIALIMFVTLPVIAFALGMKYQRALENNGPRPIATPTPTEAVACTMEAMICPDGSVVGRVPPDCEFEECPDNPITTEPGASSPQGYECPDTEYVNCEPGPGGLKWECTPEYLDWATENCEGFMGGAF